MSAIPPNWLGSVAQTTGAQARAGADHAREAREQANRITGEFTDTLSEAIEAADRDSQVYSDAEGSGSQGRADGNEEPPATAEDEPPGLDLTA
jgi:hypothetical protein